MICRERAVVVAVDASCSTIFGAAIGFTFFGPEVGESLDYPNCYGGVMLELFFFRVLLVFFDP